MPRPISAILLAGGKSSRMGKDKARLKLNGGLTMLEDIARKLAMVSDEVIIATDGRRYDGIGVRVKWAVDERPGAGSLMGLYSGLKEASHDYVLVVACDMPFLNIDLLRYMIALPRGYDILVPRVGDKIEPLHAVYSRSCLPKIASLLEADRLKISGLFSEALVRYLPDEAFEKYDPGHRSFLNINSPEELAQARAIIEKSRG